MERDVLREDLQKLYTATDMVKADCGGCKGCSDCCRGMGDSIKLDPYDIYILEQNLHLDFQQLMQQYLELNVSEENILPNLKMAAGTDSCAFLNGSGRCSIHGFRPGLCRLFPLGRYYHDQGFSYYLQQYECPKQNKTKVKINKWLGTPNLKQYEDFILKWHDLLKKIKTLLENQEDEGLKKDLNMYVLNLFYITPVQGDFYVEFENRLLQTEKLLSVLEQNK